MTTSGSGWGWQSPYGLPRTSKLIPSFKTISIICTLSFLPFTALKVKIKNSSALYPLGWSLIFNLFQTLKAYSSHTANLEHIINSSCSHCKLQEMLEASSLFIHTIYTNQNYNYGQVKSCFQ